MKPIDNSASAWESIERYVTYGVLISLIVAEILGAIIEPVDALLNERGHVILLGGSLLLVFRLLDRHLQTLRPPIDTVDFSTAINRVAEAAKRPLDVRIFANDGTRYYHFVSDGHIPIATLNVLVCDSSEAEKWKRLREKGVVGRLEVRSCDLEPAIHYLTGDQSSGMYGHFIRKPGKASPGKCFAVNGRSDAGMELLESLNEHFDNEWKQANRLYRA